MLYRQLGRTGMNASVLSIGSSALGGMYHDYDEAEGIRAVRTALDVGINLIDSSPFYGLTRAETVLGRALKGIPRDRYYLITKCGRYGYMMPDFDFSAARVTRSVDESLSRLGAEYLDVIQIHDIEFGDIDQIVNETIPALVKVKEAGKARFVGITCLPVRLFVEVSGRVPPGTLHTILSYCHYELNDTALADIVPTMDERSIGVINASPIGMGLLSLRGPADWHPAPGEVKQACRRAAEHCAARGGNIVQLAYQFAVAEPRIATTLFSTCHPANVEDNVRWIEQPMDRQLLAEVLEILRPVHNVTWRQGRPENN